MTQIPKYNQFSGFRGLTIASIRSMLKSPSSVVFSLAFPLVFILVFGFMGSGKPSVSTMLSAQSDTSNYLFSGLKNSTLVKFVPTDTHQINEKLMKGKVAALLDIRKADGKYFVEITSSPQQAEKAAQLKALVYQMMQSGDSVLLKRSNELVDVKETVIESKTFKTIDYILPGQLGFSILAASVFGTAFVFFHLRQMLVLKRFFATPIKKSVLLLSEGTARMVFQLMGAVIIIGIGKFFFDYTLIKGFFTFISMLLVCALAIIVFMSFGFMISGIAKSDSTIPPLANIFTLPQFLLADTFFSIDILPKWLQFIAKLMPLTYFNHAMRAIAFDGANLWQVRYDLLILCIWGLVGYGLAAKAFKWE